MADPLAGTDPSDQNNIARDALVGATTADVAAVQLITGVTPATKMVLEARARSIVGAWKYSIGSTGPWIDVLVNEWISLPILSIDKALYCKAGGATAVQWIVLLK